MRQCDFFINKSMAEEITIDKNLSKEEKYKTLIPQIQSLVHSETDLIANLANVCAVLKEVFNFFWVGFYFVKQDQLVLGPFQGPLACTRINYGKGVCGAAWKEKQTIVVADVDAFPGHIACSSLSRSEIVVPIIKNKDVVAVLDLDSDTYETFDETDATYLEKIVKLLDVI